MLQRQTQTAAFWRDQFEVSSRDLDFLYNLILDAQASIPLSEMATSLIDEYLPGIVEHHRPDLAFYLAGADPYAEDQLGGLALTMEGLRRRDESVLQILRRAGVPVAIGLAGGYAVQQDDTVAIHATTAAAAATILRQTAAH